MNPIKICSTNLFARNPKPSFSSLPHHPRWREHQHAHSRLQVPLRPPALVREKGLAFVLVNPGLWAFDEDPDATDESLLEVRGSEKLTLGVDSHAG
ncbi:hypothetical protein Fmac_026747 [Flemingia macrophylla]|uniref:Uncharacterized protein n=1 Tax=Flemingia macrophylla TaxID=520843 RepID=A0ABD1LGA9_9FABA